MCDLYTTRVLLLYVRHTYTSPSCLAYHEATYLGLGMALLWQPPRTAAAAAIAKPLKLSDAATAPSTTRHCWYYTRQGRKKFKHEDPLSFRRQSPSVMLHIFNQVKKKYTRI